MNQRDPLGASTSGLVRSCVKGAAEGAAIGVVASGGSFVPEAAAAGCAVHSLSYDVGLVNDTAGKLSDLTVGLKDLADEAGGLIP
jgi:hypothetical protein